MKAVESNPEKRSDRSVRPNGPKVRELRIAKGWHPRDLAGYAKCSQKTVRNVEHGDAVYMFTLVKLSKALGVEYVELLADPQDAKKPRGFAVTDAPALIKDGEFKEFSEAGDLMALTKELKRILGPTHDIIIVAVKKSSVSIEFVVTGEGGDLKLLDAFLRGELVPLGINAISLYLRIDPAAKDPIAFGRTLKTRLPTVITYGDNLYGELCRIRGIEGQGARVNG